MLLDIKAVNVAQRLNYSVKSAFIYKYVSLKKRTTLILRSFLNLPFKRYLILVHRQRVFLCFLDTYFAGLR